MYIRHLCPHGLGFRRHQYGVNYTSDIVSVSYLQQYGQVRDSQVRDSQARAFASSDSATCLEPEVPKSKTAGDTLLRTLISTLTAFPSINHRCRIGRNPVSAKKCRFNVHPRVDIKRRSSSTLILQSQCADVHLPQPGTDRIHVCVRDSVCHRRQTAGPATRPFPSSNTGCGVFGSAISPPVRTQTGNLGGPRRHRPFRPPLVSGFAVGEFDGLGTSDLGRLARR
jgi:hypothetical protein